MNSTVSIRRFGHTVINHMVEVPWDHFASGEQQVLSVFAREIVADGNEDGPCVLFLQGGPGFPAPRPVGASGWVGELLKHYRVVLLDQRGTGRSNAQLLDAQHLKLLRADQIVEDAEAVRRALGVDQWALFGQSFGGFCINTYSSRHPESISHAMLTGGLPDISAGVDEVYRRTFAQVAERSEQFYAQFPFAEAAIREVCHHLDNAEELLPTGERLSSRRFRTIGIALGRGTGFDTLGYLLEDPFVVVGGEKRLRQDFLVDVGARVSFAGHPLYALVHEAIYGGTVPGATAWSAHRVREQVEGFEEQADPRTAGKFYLTGEHIFPWQFDEDPALREHKQAAEELAAFDQWPSLYDAATLKDRAPVAAAAVYLDDIFVPYSLSMATADQWRDLRPWVTNQFQHDGIGQDGAAIVRRLREMILER